MRFLVVLLVILCSVAAVVYEPVAVERKERLSEFAFFTGKLADLTPAGDVIPYDVNTPLFSNYAEKSRFVKFPQGETAQYNDSAAFTFPVGTILIKNFYYPVDFRKPDGLRKIIETRLLVRQPGGWEAWPYVWNEDQSDAVYDPAGDIKKISYVAKNGRKKEVTYAIPNKNQCKGCHVRNESLLPIGVNARQLNRDFNYGNSKENQLAHWKALGVLSGLPDKDAIPTLAVWDNPATGSLNKRARAYLDANCGHCHSQNGPASTSGLFLDIFEQRKIHLGVGKTPVAAGRGSGNLRFDIVPGKPDQSILVFRMKTNDPAIAMPELGREQVHAEGLALIEEWIRSESFN